MELTLGSLFDGLGGWQIAAVRAGVKPIWSSEIEKFPLALTKVRFPNTKQLGDVTKFVGELQSHSHFCETLMRPEQASISHLE